MRLSSKCTRAASPPLTLCVWPPKYGSDFATDCIFSGCTTCQRKQSAGLVLSWVTPLNAAPLGRAVGARRFVSAASRREQFISLQVGLSTVRSLNSTNGLAGVRRREKREGDSSALLPRTQPWGKKVPARVQLQRPGSDQDKR